MLRHLSLLSLVCVIACSAANGSDLSGLEDTNPIESDTPEVIEEATSTAIATKVEVPKENDVLKGLATFSASATAPSGIKKVELLVDAKVVGVGVPTYYGYIVQWDSTKATDGIHLITSRATDNTGATRTSGKRTVTVLNHPAKDPKVTLLSPKQNDVLSGVVPVGATITDDTGLTGLTAKLLLDGKEIGSLVPTGYGWLYQRANGEFGLDTAAYASTIHILQVIATDKDGNQGFSSVVGVGFAAAKKPRGEMMGMTTTIDPKGNGADLDKIKGLGLKWVRVAYEWHWMSSAPGKMDWTNYDKIVSMAHSRGIKVLACALGAPAWANGGHTDNGHYPPTADHMQDYAAYAAGLATHGADAVEIWNEPNNLYSFFLPKPDVNIYAKMQIAAYPAVKKANPAIPVITGGMTPYGDLNNTSDANVKISAPVNYFKAAMAIPGFKDSFDAVGHHPYMFPGDPIDSPIGWNAFMQTKLLHDLLVAAKMGEKPFWFTEYGNTTAPGSSNALSEAGSALHYQRYLDGMTQLRDGGINLGPAFSYTLYDGAGGTGLGWELYMGVFHANGTEKPSAGVLRNAAAKLW